jgi:hypothetical protein
MSNEWNSAAHGRDPLGAFAAEAAERGGPIPGLPRGSGALAPLSALAAGALAGVVLGISAGPIAARIGGGVGAGIGLLAYLAVHSPRKREPAEGESETATETSWPMQPELAIPRRRRRSVLRLLARVVGSLLLLTASASAFVTGCLIGDDRVADQITFGMAVLSAALLAAGGKTLWFPRRDANPAGTVVLQRNLGQALARDQRFRASARRTP